MVMDMVTDIKEALEEYRKETLRLWVLMGVFLIAGILLYHKVLRTAALWAWFRAIIQCGSFVVSFGCGLNGSIVLFCLLC